MAEPSQVEVLLEDIRRACNLNEEQVLRLRQALSSWNGARVRMLTPGVLLRERAFVAACRLAVGGEEVARIRDRIMAMGVARRSAYRLIERARSEVEARIGGA